MALARLTHQCLLVMCRKSSCDVNKSPLGKVQRNFRLGQIKCDKDNKEMDHIKVDYLSKVALVVNKQYKSIKDVPPFLPYTLVYKARDKFRIKASIASGVCLTVLMLFVIKRAQGIRRREEYEGMIAVEEAKHQK